MKKKSNVNLGYKKGYCLVFSNCFDFKKINDDTHGIFHSEFVEEIPEPLRVLKMFPSVYRRIECGVKCPASVNDLCCHVFEAEMNFDTNSLRIFTEKFITKYGAFENNVI